MSLTRAERRGGFATRSHPRRAWLQITTGDIEALLCQGIDYLRRFGVRAGSHQCIVFWMKDEITPHASGNLDSRDCFLVQDFQADALISMIAQDLYPLDQCVRQKNEIIMKRNPLHLAPAPQPKGKHPRLMQERIMALFPNQNRNTKHFVPGRERVALEKVRCAKMLVSPVGKIGNSSVGCNRGEQPSVGKMILGQSSQSPGSHGSYLIKRE